MASKFYQASINLWDWLYGSPVYINQLEEVLVDLLMPNINDINIYSPKLTSDRLEGCLGFPPRNSSQPLLQKYADLAASVQLYLEHAVLLVNESISRFNLSPGCSLFLGGGIALNCKLNYSLSNHLIVFLMRSGHSLPLEMLDLQ